MLIVILVVIVIVVGIFLVARSGVATANGSGTVQMGDASSSAAGRPPIGLWGLVFGLVAALSVVMIGQASFGWLAAYDPPGWLRIVTFWLFPVSVIVSTILGALALKRDSGRAPAIAGLVLTALAAVVFFAMVLLAG